MGVCLDEDDSPEFEYLIGSFCEPDAATPAGFDRCEIAPHTWAKFRAVGPIPTAIQKVNRQIFTDWLPNNPEFELAEGVNIENVHRGRYERRGLCQRNMAPHTQKDAGLMGLLRKRAFSLAHGKLRRISLCGGKSNSHDGVWQCAPEFCIALLKAASAQPKACDANLGQCA